MNYYRIYAVFLVLARLCFATRAINNPAAAPHRRAASFANRVSLRRPAQVKMNDDKIDALRCRILDHRVP